MYMRSWEIQEIQCFSLEEGPDPKACSGLTLFFLSVSTSTDGTLSLAEGEEIVWHKYRDFFFVLQILNRFFCSNIDLFSQIQTLHFSLCWAGLEKLFSSGGWNVFLPPLVLKLQTQHRENLQNRNFNRTDTQKNSIRRKVYRSSRDHHHHHILSSHVSLWRFGSYHRRGSRWWVWPVRSWWKCPGTSAACSWTLPVFLAPSLQQQLERLQQRTRGFEFYYLQLVAPSG